LALLRGARHEVSARLGVSARSLYNWVKAVTTDKSEKQASELLEGKSEILKLPPVASDTKKNATF